MEFNAGGAEQLEKPALYIVMSESFSVKIDVLSINWLL